MAIDSRAKRQSAHRVASGPGARGLPNPDGTIGQADRQHLLGYYGGILASVIVIVAFHPPFTVLCDVTATTVACDSTVTTVVVEDADVTVSLF